MNVQKGCDYFMRIEKVNDHQIRCTLTKEDLANRELKLSELAYGTDKAKNLFRDMMQQAAYEFGFEAEDIPLMIEAIPLNSDCIVLIVTKVDDPEELDTRFSRFAPSVHDEEHDEYDDDFDDEDDEEAEEESSYYEAPAPKPATSERNSAPTAKGFLFPSMQVLNKAARILTESLVCQNSVYKEGSQYLLIVEPGDLSRGAYAKICNTLSEYSTLYLLPAGNSSYYKEHHNPIMADNALQVLATI